MAKSLYRRVQETRVKARHAKRSSEQRKATKLRIERNKASAKANRLYELNKARAEKQEAKAWLAKEEAKKRAMHEAERKEHQQKKRGKVRRLEKPISKHGKKAVKAFDKGMRSIFLR